jgi:hypothetical protein
MSGNEQASVLLLDYENRFCARALSALESLNGATEAQITGIDLANRMRLHARATLLAHQSDMLMANNEPSEFSVQRS